MNVRYKRNIRKANVNKTFTTNKNNYAYINCLKLTRQIFQDINVGRKMRRWQIY